MLLNFKEISPSNLANGSQDHFEQFAADLLQTIRYEIIRPPDRGADGKKDLIVEEIRSGIDGKTNIKWLVSCKHFAHSQKKRSVRDSDEPDIGDRLKAHGCDGFIGFYSTIPSSSLTNKLFNSKIQHIIYGPAEIEKKVLSNSERDRLLLMYFPSTFEKHQDQIASINKDTDKNLFVLNEDALLNASKTAIILLEIEKIKSKYHSSEWENREKILYKLYRYTDHSSYKVSEAVILFLMYAADETRRKMPTNIAQAIHSLTLSFYPQYKKTHENTYCEIAAYAIDMGFGLAYDAFIYLKNYRIAEYVLSILKLIYKEAKKNNLDKILKSVMAEYDNLEDTLKRPERNDLDPAQELTALFRKDIDGRGLAFPVLPEYLYEIVEQGDKK